MKAVKLIIEGNVTSVGFRYFIRENAVKLNIKGYVRNIQDKVESVLEGTNIDVDKMVELCKKGSKFASVTNINIKEIRPLYLNKFEIR